MTDGRSMTKFGLAAGAATEAALREIALTDTGVDRYRDVMHALGRTLGNCFCANVNVAAETVYVAMTVEDADFLGDGFLEALAEHGADDLRIACFWNRRAKTFGIDVAPIVQEYRDPYPEHIDHLVILKSIISGGCVVKTNLMHILDDAEPERIHVVSPVMMEWARDNLTHDFSEDIVDRFEFMALAVDNKLGPDGAAIPGIGGEVYERLGLGSQVEKNKRLPNLVRERMEAYEEKYSLGHGSRPAPI